MAVAGESASGGMVDTLFMSMMVPGMLVGIIGSTVLGIALVRARFQPRLTAWLLALALPLFVVGGIALGHNSIGFVPLFVAWGTTGLTLRRDSAWASDTKARYEVSTTSA